MTTPNPSSSSPTKKATVKEPEPEQEQEERCLTRFLSCVPVIDRAGTFATAWAALLTLNVVASICFLVPFRIGFYLRDWQTWIGPDIVCDLIFLVNMFVQMRTSFEQDGEEVRDPKRIEDAYLGWTFVRDVVGIFPLEIFSLAFPSKYEPAFRANKMIFVVLLPDLFERWERLTTIKPSIIRIWKSIFVVFFCTHIMGCIFHLISLLEGDSALESFTGTRNLNSLDLTNRYFRSVFWSFVTMTGYNNTNPNTLAEAIFSFFVTLMGISLFATIIGSVGSLVTNLDSSKLYFRQKLDSINEYMSYKQIPEELQNEVRNYFLYLWKSGKGLDKNQALDQLPQYLKHKMNMFLNSDVVSRVTLFEKWKNDENFLQEIVKNLTTRIYLPRAVVVCEGDIGTEMYFVSHGELNVISSCGTKVVWTFKDGDYFGEIAILLDAKRTATIVARTYCDMSILTKEAFKKVLRRFPEIADGMKVTAEDRLAKLKQQSSSAPGAENDHDDDKNGGQHQQHHNHSVNKNDDDQHENSNTNNNNNSTKSPSAEPEEDQRVNSPPQNPLSAVAAATTVMSDQQQQPENDADADDQAPGYHVVDEEVQ